MKVNKTLCKFVLSKFIFLGYEIQKILYTSHYVSFLWMARV